jgi:hypothetical protein
MKREFFNQTVSFSKNTQEIEDIDILIEFFAPYIVKLLDTNKVKKIENSFFARFLQLIILQYQNIINKFRTIPLSKVRSKLS